MRLWSIHPKYLDAKGLVALWREGLLAQNVLHNKTKGYKNHPQLIRFKNTQDPQSAIECYLHSVVDEADKRGYKFNRDKILSNKQCHTIHVNSKQLSYEFTHLLNKLKTRDPERYQKLEALKEIETHPLFEKIEGPVEDWEII
ncbi:pyrimidine dimer DNA glycosylase/endonuclease V [Sulfurimonas sp. C5]|uniref:pyrimidine dimer DNA glycosylase/endonuclease V n=1 Tax=Sulfurimonas sp. C5 TaxID=3036947 RepID=UPI00245524DC|nr:pyrimidine dimer DNA glycosylase/endonuclease V [Sulfurimonas sp. C5]MDH4944691.1 pyrimidine dimer DNA glycosylase/endonuclease V [Sulfurimonas sp. C5]